MFIFQVVGWVIFVYGFLSLAQDIFNEITYKRISHNMKIVVFVKKMEENLDNFVKELSIIKKNNGYKQIIVIDLEEKDDLEKIVTRLENDEVNIKLMDKEEGEVYVSNYFENENVSFL